MKTQKKMMDVARLTAVITNESYFFAGKIFSTSKKSMLCLFFYSFLSGRPSLQMLNKVAEENQINKSLLTFF